MKRLNSNENERHSPPGRTKIMAALRTLLESKDFSDVTTAEIAKTAGVTEALIYKYFKDKRDLLYRVLAEYLEQFLVNAETELKGIKGIQAKIRKSIWTHIHAYAKDRVFAKMLILQVRGFTDYYSSHPYKLVKKYSRLLLRLIKTGIKQGEIRTDLPPELIRQVILGCIEQVCLTHIAFNREILVDELTDNLCLFIFKGLEP